MIAALSLAVLAASSQASVAAQRLDLRAKAMSVGAMLERLSLASGASLKATPALAREIVFIHVTSVTPEDVKKRLATGLDATWTSKSDAEYLGRSPADERAIWNRHVALRRKYVEEALAQTKKQLEQPFDAKALANGLAALKTAEAVPRDPLAARKRHETEVALFAKGPAARLLKRLALACNPNDLAAVGPYERHLFSPSPTRRQKRIDVKLYSAALSAFAKEQQAWIDAAGEVELSGYPEGRIVSDPRAQLKLTPAFGENLSLEVKRGDVGGLFMANLIAPRGESFDRVILTQEIFADPLRRFLDVGRGEATTASEDREVKLSDDAQLLQRAFSAAIENRPQTTRSPRLLELLIRVDLNEPLALAPSDALSAYAEAKGLNVIAALPDTAFNMVWYALQGGPLKAGGFVRALVDSGTVELREEEGWATLIPPDRYEANLSFSPRNALADLMQRVHAKGIVDARDYARFAFESGRVTRLGLSETLLMIYDRSIAGGLDRTDWKALQLFGSFTLQQQLDLETGARFGYSGMSLAQRSVVERIVFAGEIRSEETISDNMVRLHRSPVEPTEEFPNGVPPGAVVSARAKSIPVLVAYAKGADGKVRALRSLDTWNLAHVEVNIVGNPEEMARYSVPGLIGYAPGAHKVVALRVELGPGLWKEVALTVPEYDANATPLPWDKLPDPYPKRIAEAIEQVRAQKAAQPARTIPPRRWTGPRPL